MRRRKLSSFIAVLMLTLAMLVPSMALADEADIVAQDVTAATEPVAVVTEQVADEPDVGGEAVQEVAAPSEEEPATPEGELPEAVVEDDAAAPENDGTGDDAADDAMAKDVVETTTDEVSDAPQAQEPVATALEPTAGEQAMQVTSEGQAALDAFAAAHAHDIAEGTYAIKSGLGNNLVMDVDHAGKTDGTTILIWEFLNATNQQWELKATTGGYFTIASKSSGKYLDIAGGDTKAGPFAGIVQWSERKDGSRGQLWVISQESDGYKFTSAVLGAKGERYVLDVYGGNATMGAKLTLWTDKKTQAANQRWTFAVTDKILDALAKEHKGDLADGTYFISSELGSKLVLDIEYASRDNAAAAVVWPKNPSANEGWTVSHNAAGYLTITNALSGKVLDVYGGTASIGASVIQWVDKHDGARNQQWIAAKQSDGTYHLVSALPFSNYLVLDVYGAKAVPQAKTILWVDKGDGAANQRWSFDEAPEQYAYAHSVADGTYTVRTALDATKTLDVYQALDAAGTQVILWVAHGGNSANQRWTITHDNQGYAHLTNVNSKKELGFSEAGKAVQVAGSFNWVIEPQSDGTYRFRAATGTSAGKYLDVDHAKTDNGTTVLAWASNGGRNQTWVIRGGGANVIALDPGHGGNDSGATANGLRECDLTWSITQACAERLRSYGYEVYITVSEAEFKNGGIPAVTLASRVQRAADHGAAAIFSIHINAGGGHGAVTLVPNNSSYHYELYQQGQQFAQTLLPKINAIGIGTWGDGAWERNYSTGDGAEANRYYDGGGFQDYYGIVRYARLKGMLGVIIEHGFIDSSDANLLRQAVVQARLGQADAEAINAIYG